VDHAVKRFLIIFGGLMLLCFTLVFAAEKQATPVPPTPRVPEMSTAGRVMAVSDTILKIERTLKGKAEIMEFTLEKPFANIAVGDQLKVSYIEKNGLNVLIRVAPSQKTAVQKSKKETPKAVKPVAPPAPLVAK
jgi:hypothetical protein